MVFKLDKDKDASNQSKHGYPLALGWIVLQNAVADIHDPREYMTEFGLEERRIACGLVASRLFVCVYTMRDEVCRLISVRKANKREQQKWL
jgi:uncharacterized DUF497 family protein